MWPFRRKVDWLASDWAVFFAAGGVLSVEDWERMTPASRGQAVVARAWVASGRPEAPPERTDAPAAGPAMPDGVAGFVDALKSIGATAAGGVP